MKRKKNPEKLYYYFCPKCKKAIGREFKKNRWVSFCDKSGEDSRLILITKRKI